MDEVQAEKSANIRLGERFAHLREQAGMSQEELAEAIRELGFKWTHTTVYNIEKGARALRVAEADAALRLMRRSMSDLTTSRAQAAAIFAHDEATGAWNEVLDKLRVLEAREMELATTLDEAVASGTLTKKEASDYVFALSPLTAASTWSRGVRSQWMSKQSQASEGTFVRELLDSWIAQDDHAPLGPPQRVDDGD